MGDVCATTRMMLEQEVNEGDSIAAKGRARESLVDLVGITEGGVASL